MLGIASFTRTDTDSSRGMRAGGEFHRDPHTILHSFWIDVKLAAQ